ncbi:hypothetical protein CR513_13248, partial [Mucuna pruriens]
MPLFTCLMLMGKNGQLPKTQRGFFLCCVSPGNTSVSISSLSISASNSQSKELRRLARIRSNEAIAIGIPGQILRPAPNGINSKFCPRKSIIKRRIIELMKITYYGKASRTRWKGWVLEGSTVLEEE